MSYWEWLRSGSIKKNLQKRSAARSSGAYGNRYRRDQTAPERVESFVGEGFTWEEVEDLIEIANTPADAADDAGLVEIEDHLGQAWKGAIAFLSWDPVSEGGTIYWELKLDLDEPEKVVAP